MFRNASDHLSVADKTLCGPGASEKLKLPGVMQNCEQKWEGQQGRNLRLKRHQGGNYEGKN